MEGRSPDHSFVRTQVQKHGGKSLAVATGDVSGAMAPGKKLSRQPRSLTRHPTLRRRPSEPHLRPSATARLGVPQAEALLALEASRVREGLHRSVPDPDLAERRPEYPSQFDSMPYDPQPNADDQIIRQLLLDWTPHGAGAVPREDEGARMETQQGILFDDRHIDAGGGQDGRGLSPAIADNVHASPEQSIRSDAVLPSHQGGDTPKVETQITWSAETGSKIHSERQERAEDEECLVWETDSAAEIARLEDRLATLKSVRNAKQSDKRLLSEELGESTQLKDEEMPAPDTFQTTEEGHPIPTQQVKYIFRPHLKAPQKPVVQRRVTMDEVEDEGDSRDPHEDIPVENRDDDDKGKKATRASTFPIQTSEAELDWAKRVLQDSEALSEPNDLAASENALRSQSRRHIRASRRQLSM